MGKTVDKLNYLLGTKEAIRDAIENKGVEVSDSDTFRSYADKIEAIETGEPINNQEKSISITSNGTRTVTPDTGYTGLSKVTIQTNVPTSGGGDTPTPERPTWTGHADVEGLKAIGWTDEDIAYYQANGVNWNEEDDEYHLITDDNKALYGVLTANNISSYKSRIVYLPKIDTSKVTNMSYMFQQCYSLVAIPQLDTANVTNMSYMFYYCYSLVSVPLLDTSKVTNMSYMFYNCCSLVSVPLLDTSKVTNMSYMFYYCYSLVSVPLLDTSKVANMSYMFHSCYSLVSVPLLDTSSVTTMSKMFHNCCSLVSVPLLDTSKVTNVSSMFNNCFSLKTSDISGLTKELSLSSSALLSKESLLYIIENEASTAAIAITLNSYAKTRLSTDADIVAALANHPNITLQ